MELWVSCWRYFFRGGLDGVVAEWEVEEEGF